MLLNQNHISSGVKRTKFLFAKTIFLLLKQCSYDFCTHLWKLFTVFQWKSFKFPKFVKACPRDNFFPLSRGPLFISVQFIETSILIQYGLLLLTGEDSRLSLRYVRGFDSVVFLRVFVLHRTVVWLV